MKRWTIYKATHRESGATYVGQTFRSFHQRQKEHFHSALEEN